MKVPGGSEELFPFLLGGTFIEARSLDFISNQRVYFPSFWEGLSLRPKRGELPAPDFVNFPSFWEGLSLRRGNVAQTCPSGEAFPFLFGGGFH